MMALKNPLCLGGGHGVRAYLPQELQRFSIDLDFYSTCDDIHTILKETSRFGSLKVVGYGIESEGMFKRYDSQIPANAHKCTAALLKGYKQSFKAGDVDSEFYVTISNTLKFEKYEMRKPKSYIGIEYVKGEIPVLSAALIIAGKIRIIPHRKLKDRYKDVFDIYALLNLSDASVDESDIIIPLSSSGSRIRRSAIFEKFKETSDSGNARNAIRLPSESRQAYLANWKDINSFVMEETFRVLGSAGILDNQ